MDELAKHRDEQGKRNLGCSIENAQSGHDKQAFSDIKGGNPSKAISLRNVTRVNHTILAKIRSNQSSSQLKIRPTAGFLTLQDLQLLCDALSYNTSTSELDLEGCSIGNIGCVALKDLLQKNTALSSLDLQMCQISDEGCAQLAAGIVSFKGTMKRLYLGNNDITFEGIQALVASFVQHPDLEIKMVGSGHLRRLECPEHQKEKYEAEKAKCLKISDQQCNDCHRDFTGLSPNEVILPDGGVDINIGTVSDERAPFSDTILDGRHSNQQHLPTFFQSDTVFIQYEAPQKIGQRTATSPARKRARHPQSKKVEHRNLSLRRTRQKIQQDQNESKPDHINPLERISHRNDQINGHCGSENTVRNDGLGEASETYPGATDGENDVTTLVDERSSPILVTKNHEISVHQSENKAATFAHSDVVLKGGESAGFSCDEGTKCEHLMQDNDSILSAASIRFEESQIFDTEWTSPSNSKVLESFTGIAEIASDEKRNAANVSLSLNWQCDYVSTAQQSNIRTQQESSSGIQAQTPRTHPIPRTPGLQPSRVSTFPRQGASQSNRQTKAVGAKLAFNRTITGHFPRIQPPLKRCEENVANTLSTGLLSSEDGSTLSGTPFSGWGKPRSAPNLRKVAEMHQKASPETSRPSLLTREVNLMREDAASGHLQQSVQHPRSLASHADTSLHCEGYRVDSSTDAKHKLNGPESFVASLPGNRQAGKSILKTRCTEAGGNIAAGAVRIPSYAGHKEEHAEPPTASLAVDTFPHVAWNC